MKYYKDRELKFFNGLKDDLILSIFDGVDKRYCIDRFLKRAYDRGVLGDLK